MRLIKIILVGFVLFLLALVFYDMLSGTSGTMSIDQKAVGEAIKKIGEIEQ
jgi:hypothetical protein